MAPILNFTVCVHQLQPIKTYNNTAYLHYDTHTHTRSKYLSLNPASNNSQSNHRLIALRCYLQHIPLRTHQHTHPHPCTYTHTQLSQQRSNSKRLSVDVCFWNKLQFIRIVNIPWGHLKSTSQIQGAYYTTLLPNHTSRRDFHSQAASCTKQPDI